MMRKVYAHVRAWRPRVKVSAACIAWDNLNKGFERSEPYAQVMQDWPSDDMIFSPAQILAYASERVNLTPGDIVLTGSPPGNGMHHGGRFLRDGDVIESSISGLGRQRNRCVQEPRPARPLAFGLWKNTEGTGT